jgi:dUTPase
MDIHLFFYKLLSSHGSRPIRVTENSAGFDLKSARSLWLRPKEVVKVPLDLMLMFPKGVYGRIASRSGLASKGITALGKSTILKKSIVTSVEMYMLFCTTALKHHFISRRTIESHNLSLNVTLKEN